MAWSKFGDKKLNPMRVECHSNYWVFAWCSAETNNILLQHSASVCFHLTDNLHTPDILVFVSHDFMRTCIWAFGLCGESRVRDRHQGGPGFPVLCPTTAPPGHPGNRLVHLLNFLLLLHILNLKQVSVPLRWCSCNRTETSQGPANPSLSSLVACFV